MTVRKLENALDVENTHPVAVWLLASERGTGKTVADESLEQVVKHVEWALALSVSLAKNK